MINDNMNNENANIAVVNIASVGARVRGGIVDLIVALIFFVVFGYSTGLGVMPANGIGMSLSGWAFVSYLFLYLFAYCLLEYFTGKTPGKFLVHTRVVREDNSRITFWQALVRNFFRLIDGLLLYLLGLIIILCSKNRQRLGDLLAKTYVVMDP